MATLPTVGGSNNTWGTELNAYLQIEHNTDGTHKQSTFSAHKNAVDQTGIATATSTKVTFETEDWDTNNNFASSRFTPSIAGKYHLIASVYYATSVVDTMYVNIYIYKNGALWKGQNNRASGALDLTSFMDVIVDANGTTDYFEVYTYHNAGTDRTIRGDVYYTYFQGYKIN